MNTKSYILQNKKMLIKVIASIVLLVVAFSIYMNKNNDDNNNILITDLPSPENNTTTEALEALRLEMENTTEPATIIIDVCGAVSNPSVVHLNEGGRVYEAIDKAGGLTSEADTRSINLAQILMDGEKIYVPTKKEIESSNALNSINNSIQSQHVRSSLININTADSVALQALSGVGPSTAEKIIDYREENGKYRSIDDLKNVSGIGEKTFEKLKSKITI